MKTNMLKLFKCIISVFRWSIKIIQNTIFRYQGLYYLKKIEFNVNFVNEGDIKISMPKLNYLNSLFSKNSQLDN